MKSEFEVASISQTLEIAAMLASKIIKTGQENGKQENTTNSLNSHNRTLSYCANSHGKRAVFTLAGELGAGKTEFCRGFINSFFQNPIDVISPSFNLLQIYSPCNYPEIYHYDLYRLNHAEEVFELGLEDAIANNIVLIEWADVARNILPEDTIEIQIKKIANNPNKRLISIENVNIG